MAKGGMEMEWCILYVFMFITSYYYVESTCQMRGDLDMCRYTIVCEYHPGSLPNPSCEYEPHVTFTMINSVANVLSRGFFGATNFDSRIRVLRAVNNSWTEIATNTFSYYSETIEIDLSGNQIRVIQKEAFRGLYKLKVLNVSFNFIETLQTYALSAGDSVDFGIETLDLSNNLLSDIQGYVFDQCANLGELYLQNNNIAKLEDNVFINLQYLTLLYLQYNKITELNMTLAPLKLLRDLDLSYNAIVKLSGVETNHLISLERVNMSNNLIRTVEANCFNQAFNLQSLDLSNNNITSAIANTMFINNNKLSYLNFYNNTITKIQENAFQHNSLVDLNLEKNFISGEITESTFRGLQKIKHLTLYKQNITVVNANAFMEMTSLASLNLSANNINVIDQSGFNNTASLVVLDLSYNNIKDLKFLNDVLVNLTAIYLNNNKIELIPKYAFINQSWLKTLDISYNRIITIEQYALPLSNLQYLNILGNPITGSIKSNVFSPGQYLRFLDMSNLNITRIEEMALIDLPRLARLNLSCNSIEYIGQRNFINVNNMFSLDVSNNRLTNISLNGTFIKSLSALYLNNNKLSSVIGAIPNSTAIMYLDISHNDIPELTVTAFETLKELRVLRAMNNKLKVFNNPQLNTLSKLKDLDLSSNQISEIDLKFYKDLVRVDISNNSLNNVNSTLLANADNLQVLNISRNNISILQPGVFKNAKILKILNISSNNLGTLRYGSLRGLHKTEIIDLSNNNLTEMDIDMFHECEELTTLIVDYNRIKYLDVEQLTNVVPKLRSLSIGGNPLDCKQIVRSIKTNKTAVVAITSIHQVFHEDNVNGIRCGKTYLNATVSPVTPLDISNSTELSLSSPLFIWCSVLTVLIILLIIGFLYWKRYHTSLNGFSQSRMQFSPSVELSGSDYRSNLLHS